MAKQPVVHSFSRRLLLQFTTFLSISTLILLAFIALFAFAPASSAQFQSAFVFSSDPKGVAVYTRNDATGVLTPVSGSPFPSREAVTFLALDFKGRYLFTASFATSKISMFTVDPNTGALQEVAASPFATANTNTPMFLAPELTGQLLYVINFFGSSNSVSSLESFDIDPATQSLIPSKTLAVDLPGLLKGAAVHPSGKTFYGYFNDSRPSNPEVASFLVFNSANGSFTTNAFPQGSPAIGLAMDPAGLHPVITRGNTNAAQINSYQLNSDGTLSQFGALTDMTMLPESLVFDILGQYLYVTLSDGVSQASTVHIFSPTFLTEFPNSPLPSSFTSTASWLVDPSAPLIFADQVYQVSPADGSLSSILGSNTLVSPTVFSLSPGSQPIEGPVAQLSSTSFVFGSLAIGIMSAAQGLTITNTGGQNLTINTLAIVGTNSTDFSEQDTCHVPTVLTPKQSCTAMITFTPTATGARSASLTITDNAAPPSESVTLSGAGLQQSPPVSLVPGNVTFGSPSPITAGTSATNSVTVTNSGGLALHVLNIALSGPNSNDFSFSAPNCSAPIAVNSNCPITVTFFPLAAGLRSATITLTDDAPDSPQNISIAGTANPAVTIAPTTGASTTATIAAGQPANYSLQMTPGTGYTGSVSLTCTGAPRAATCNVPANILISNGAAAPFTVTVSTVAAGSLPPISKLPRIVPPNYRFMPLFALCAVICFCLMLTSRRRGVLIPHRSVWNYSHIGIILLLAATGISGCGGGSTAVIPPPPPQIFTPPGTSKLLITATPAAQVGKQLAPQTIQLTLTVN